MPRSIKSKLLRAHTVPSNITFKDSNLEIGTPYDFDRIVGLEVGRSRLGIPSDEVRTLEVPATWAERLLDFHRAFAEHPKRFGRKSSTTRFPYQVGVNCHGFADFMKGRAGRFAGPDQIITLGTPIVEPGMQPVFGEHLAFGIRGHNTDDFRASLRDAGFAFAIPRFNAAYHSAIALGEVAEGEVINVTSDSGYLAFDSLARYREFARSSDPYQDNLGWYTYRPS